MISHHTMFDLLYPGVVEKLKKDDKTSMQVAHEIVDRVIEESKKQDGNWQKKATQEIDQIKSP